MGMTLQELINKLSKEDPNRIVSKGFTNPISYRGDYECVAFIIINNVPISKLLSSAKLAMHNTYQGYKGGEYTMDEDTECYLVEGANYTGTPITELVYELLLNT